MHNEELHMEVPSNDLPTRSLSVHARAQQILALNQISFDPKIHVFTVKSSSGVPQL